MERSFQEKFVTDVQINGHMDAEIHGYTDKYEFIFDANR